MGTRTQSALNRPSLEKWLGPDSEPWGTSLLFERFVVYAFILNIITPVNQSLQDFAIAEFVSQNQANSAIFAKARKFS